MKLLLIIIIFILLLFYLSRKSEGFTSTRKKKVIYPWKDVKLEDKQRDRFFADDLHKKYKSYTDDTIKKDTIFVSIASYRDKNCIKTVKEIFGKAKNPEKVFLGICTQNKDESEACIDDTLDKYKDNIKEKKLTYREALGPQYARYECSHLWDGEEYFLMIDSHLLFRENWDEIIKNMYKKLPTDKGILTGYPPAHEDKNAFNDKSFTYTCSSHFDHDNFHIISEAQGKKSLSKEDIWSTPYASAGFFFTSYKWLYDVPFDPYLPHLFQGEEILLATRSYTNGWDLFNPNRHVATHYYDRRKDNEPHFWEDNHDYEIFKKLSNMRYYHIIDECPLEDVHPEFRKHLDYYGLGKVRTLQDYFEFANMNLKEDKIDSRCNSKYNYKEKKWELLK